MSGSSSPVVPPELIPVYNAAGKSWGVAPSLLAALGHVESNNATTPITSSAGAEGTQQIIPVTGQALGMTNLQDPTQSIWASAKLLRQNLDRYKDPVQALMAYNGGTDPSKWNNPQTQAYPQLVSKAQQALLASPPSQGKPTMATSPSLLPTLGGLPQDTVDVQSSTTPATTSPASGSILPTLAGLPSAAQDDPELDAASGGATAPGVMEGVGAGAARSAITMFGLPMKLAGRGEDYLRAKLGLPPTNSEATADNWINGLQQYANNSPAADSATAKLTEEGLDVVPAIAGGGLAEGAVGGLLGGGGRIAEALGSPVVGGALKQTGKLLAGEVGKAASIPERIANVVGRGMTQGAGSGAAVAGPQGQTPQQVAENAGAGALFNTGAHTLGSVVAPIGGAMIHGILRSAQTEPQALGKVLNELTARFAASGMTPEQAISKAQALGPGATVGNLPDSAVNSVATEMAKTPGAPRDQMMAAMGAHNVPGVPGAPNSTSPGGLLDILHMHAPQILQDGFGVQNAGASDLSQFMAQNHAEAERLYNKANVDGKGAPIIDPTPASIQQMVEAGHPEIMSALAGHLKNGFDNAVNNAARGRGPVPNPQDWDLMVPGPPDAQGNPTQVLNPQMPFQASQDLKNSLAGIQKGTLGASAVNNSSLGRLVGKNENVPGYLQDLNNELKTTNPNYARATQLTADANSAGDAYLAGQNFNKMSVSDINDYLNGTADKPAATPAQKKWFQGGVLQRMSDDIRKTALSGNPVAPFVNHYLANDRLQAVAPQADIAKLSQGLHNIGYLANSGKKLLTTNITPEARSSDWAGELGPAMMKSLVLQQPGHVAGAAANLLRTAAGIKRTPVEAQQLAGILFNPDLNMVRQVFASHKVATPSVANRLLSAVTPRAAVGLPTALAAGAHRPQPNALAPFIQTTPQQQQ